jgi:hypothetical protein
MSYKTCNFLAEKEMGDNIKIILSSEIKSKKVDIHIGRFQLHEAVLVAAILRIVFIHASTHKLSHMLLRGANA